MLPVCVTNAVRILIVFSRLWEYNLVETYMSESGYDSETVPNHRFSNFDFRVPFD